MTSPAAPELRQCLDPDDPLFGASALRTEMPEGGWGVMTVANGGHHSTDDDVKDWVVLTPPAKKAAAKKAVADK